MPRPLRRTAPETRTTSSCAVSHAPRLPSTRSTTNVWAHLLERATSRFELACHAWCFLPNHLHLLVTSRLGNLVATRCTGSERTPRSRSICGTSALAISSRGRFGSRLVEDDGYFLELARYLPLNPVRAGLCSSPGEWPWSSYAATAGLRRTPPWFLDASRYSACSGLRMRTSPGSVEDGESDALDEFGRPNSPPRPSLAAILPTDSDERCRRCPFRARLQQGRDRAASRSEPLADQPPAFGARSRRVCTLGVRSARSGSDPHVAGQTPSVHRETS